MSSYVKKFIIKYDGNDGMTYTQNIYCKYIGSWCGEQWYNEDGTPVDFGCVTDSQAEIISHCIAGIPVQNKYFYWKEVEEFTLPEKLAEVFNYKL